VSCAFRAPLTERIYELVEIAILTASNDKKTDCYIPDYAFEFLWYTLWKIATISKEIHLIMSLQKSIVKKMLLLISI
jgi:hypothetical protein